MTTKQSYRLTRRSIRVFLARRRKEAGDHASRRGKERIMTNTERQAEALGRARDGLSVSNYAAIFQGFISKDVVESEIKPRDNVLTYEAWRAVGRQVRRGEHGVKINIYLTIAEKRNEETGEVERPAGRRPWITTVFHISQTDPANGRASR